MDATDSGKLDRVTAYMHDSVERALVLANIILAILMLFYALINVYHDVSVSLTWNNVLASASLVICAFMILVDGERNLVRSTGFMILGLGCYRFLTVITSIHTGDPESIIYMVLALIGINLAYSGSHYIRGVARGRKYTVASMVAMIFINLGGLILYMQSGHSFFQTVEAYPVAIGMTVLYFGAVGILESEPIRSRDRDSIQNHKIAAIRETYAPYSGIDWDAAAVLLSSMVDRSSWSTSDCSGPVVAEFRFRIIGGNDRAFAVVQEWKGHDMLHVTITDHESGTIIHANRFSYNYVDEDVDEEGVRTIRLYGPEGCHQLHVMTEEELEEFDPYA